MKISVVVQEPAPQILLGTDLPTTSSLAEAAVAFPQILSQEFTLTSAVTIDTIQILGFPE